MRASDEPGVIVFGMARLYPSLFQDVLGDGDSRIRVGLVFSAWLAAGFMFIGYMTHLALDEIYSVDVMDTRIKASFGTAIKLVDRKHWGHTGAMAAATILAFMLTPSTKLFVHNLTAPSMWSSLHAQLLPRNGGSWFGINLTDMVARARHIGNRVEAAEPTQPPSPISTGSVTPATPAAPAPPNPVATVPESKPQSQP